MHHPFANFAPPPMMAPMPHDAFGFPGMGMGMLQPRGGMMDPYGLFGSPVLGSNSYSSSFSGGFGFGDHAMEGSSVSSSMRTINGVTEKVQFHSVRLCEEGWIPVLASELIS